MEREGVIKFNLDFEAGELAEVDIRDLRAWRVILASCGLIGQDPGRYGGLGFGNISMRVQDGFVVSGSQTGHLPDPGPEGYAFVCGWRIEESYVRARGMVKPSSESLTHAAVYDSSDSIGYVFHIHSPDIWRNAGQLGLPITDRKCRYGTPEMAAEVGKVMNGETGVFAMGGHEDGVVAYGSSASAPGLAVIGLMAKALTFQQ